MKRSRFSKERVAYALRQAETGTPVGDVCRQLALAGRNPRAWALAHVFMVSNAGERVDVEVTHRTGPALGHRARADRREIGHVPSGTDRGLIRS